MDNSAQLTELQLAVGRLVSHMESERENRVRTNQKIDEMHEGMFGSAKVTNPISLRVDRLEQVQENRKWVVRAMAVGLIGLIGDKIKAWLSH